MSREDSGKHSQRFRKVNTEVTKVEFSPDVVTSFRRLEAFVHNSDHFAPEMIENLQDLASGKPAHLDTAMVTILYIGRETMKHVQATGDKRAEDALRDLASALNDNSKDPVTVLALERSSARR